MNYRTLGKTDLQIAEVGMGTWQLANDPGMWVGADLDESLRALDTYVEKGGNFIDTAWVYGFDDEKPGEHPSEQLIGKYLKQKGNRDKVVLATKVAPHNWHWPAWGADTLDDCYPAGLIETQVNDSLRSLQVDSLDLVQFHVWHDNWADEDRWKEEIQKLTKEGKVKHWGISANDYQPSNCIKALDTGLISTVQCIFNIFHQKPTEKLLPYAIENNIGIIARVALDEGGLTGKYTNETSFPDGDFRGEYFGGERRAELVQRMGALREVVESHDGVETLTELALRYVLSFDALSTVIPGMRTVEYVEANTDVSGKGPLCAEVLAELKKHAWERNFYGVHDPEMEVDGYIEV